MSHRFERSSSPGVCRLLCLCAAGTGAGEGPQARLQGARPPLRGAQDASHTLAPTLFFFKSLKQEKGHIPPCLKKNTHVKTDLASYTHQPVIINLTHAPPRPAPSVAGFSLSRRTDLPPVWARPFFCALDQSLAAASPLPQIPVACKSLQAWVSPRRPSRQPRSRGRGHRWKGSAGNEVTVSGTRSQHEALLSSRHN